MNIQSTMRAPQRSVDRASAPTDTPAPQTSIPSPPTDTVDTSPKGEGVRHIVGGVAGVGMSLAGVYAGVLGGAVVGSLFGAGMGPAVASLSTKGALGFLGGIWNSTSTAAQIGMVVGGASGLIGGFKLGRGIGDQAAKLAGAKPLEKRSWSPLNSRGRTATTVVTGLGSTSGMVGGTLIGAGLGATGSVLAQGFNLSQMGGASLIGAGVGLVAGATIAGAGSYLLARETMQLTGLGAKVTKSEAKKLSNQKSLLTAGAGVLGAVGGATPLLGGFYMGVSADSMEDAGYPRLASSAAWISAGTNIAGSLGWFMTGNPLYMIPAAVTGAAALGIKQAAELSQV